MKIYQNAICRYERPHIDNTQEDKISMIYDLSFDPVSKRYTILTPEGINTE